MKTREQAAAEYINESRKNLNSDSVFTIARSDLYEHWNDAFLAGCEFEAQNRWIPVSERLPVPGERALWRAELKWRSKPNYISFFDDELTGETEPLEYGGIGYCLKDHDYLAVPHDTDYCDEIVTHWMPLPSPPKPQEL